MPAGGRRSGEAIDCRPGRARHIDDRLDARDPGLAGEGPVQLQDGAARRRRRGVGLDDRLTNRRDLVEPFGIPDPQIVEEDLASGNVVAVDPERHGDEAVPDRSERREVDRDFLPSRDQVPRCRLVQVRSHVRGDIERQRQARSGRLDPEDQAVVGRPVHRRRSLHAGPARRSGRDGEVEAEHAAPLVLPEAARPTGPAQPDPRTQVPVHRVPGHLRGGRHVPEHRRPSAAVPARGHVP